MSKNNKKIPNFYGFGIFIYENLIRQPSHNFISLLSVVDVDLSDDIDMTVTERIFKFVELFILQI